MGQCFLRQLLTLLNQVFSECIILFKDQFAVDGKVEIRPMMYLALSYDHRIIDGNQSVGFLIAVKEGVEDPENILMDGKVKKSLGLN